MSGPSYRDQTSRPAGFAAALLAGSDQSQAFAEVVMVLGDVGERLASARIINKLRPLRIAADRDVAEDFRVGFDAAERALAG